MWRYRYFCDIFLWELVIFTMCLTAQRICRNFRSEWGLCALLLIFILVLQALISRIKQKKKLNIIKTLRSVTRFCKCTWPNKRIYPYWLLVIWLMIMTNAPKLDRRHTPRALEWKPFSHYITMQEKKNPSTNEWIL